MGVNVQGPSMPHNRGILSIMTTLLAITTTIPFTQGQNCLLPETFNPYFQAALDDIESTFTNDVVGGLNDIGLGPIAQLSINDLIDFKQSIFEPLFGNPVQRNEWINVTSVLNVKAQLESKLDDIIGSIPPGLSMTCELETTDDLEEEELPYRFGMEFVLTGSLLGDDLDLTLLSPKIAVLPEDSFNPLELTVQALSIDYALTLPLTIDTKRRKFMIGEITISLEGSLNTDVLQSISLTETVSQDFQGSLALDMTLSYSSVSDWAYTASFESSLTAETSVGTAVANLGLVAMDDDLFDDKPPTVVFDFDACEYTALIKTSIQAFTFSNEINSIVETHLDPVLDRATIFPESFTHNIKSAIVSATEAKVNEAKAAVIAQLDALFESCGRRRLGEVAELPQDGSQRMLAADGLKFGDLATSIQVIDGVTVTAGLYPGRQEIAVDITIHMEQVFDKSYFTDAISAIFTDLGPAQAMFGAASEVPNILALLDAASSVVAFDMALSTGIKVENVFSVLAEGADAAVSLFIRLDNLGVFAEATVSSVDLDIFPGVAVEHGDFLISAGVRIAAPFEGEVTIDGNMATEISFSHTLTSVAFTPYGQLRASLPFEATINEFTQTLTIKFEDDNLFDTDKFLVKVDFPVCPVVSVVDGLLAKLGSLGLSPKQILGPVATAGLDLADTLDDYFPNLEQFIDGILEAKNELFHLCAEAAETGEAGPLLEDVISMLVEDVLDFGNLFTAEGCTTERRHRALREARLHRATSLHATAASPAPLKIVGDHRGRRALRKTHPMARHLQRITPRASHLRYNHFTRPPRRRHLQAECSSAELLDGLFIKGGYDGSQIFVKLELDVSKGAMEDLRDVILKPLQLLGETEFLQDLNLFSGGNSVIDSIFDSINADISFSAGAHMGVTVGFELQGNEFIQVPTMTQAQIASRSFIQFDDISAKFATTARASGYMDIASVGNIGIENATISFAFGLGVVEISDKIYFNEISSVILALKQHAKWQKVGMMDITIPLFAAIEFTDGIDLNLSPIISITSPDLFTPDLPSISVDLNLQELIADGEDLIATLLSKLTAGMIDISADGIAFSGGPFGEIQGILDQFGLNFDDLTTEFMSKYNAFKTDLLDLSPDQELIFNLRPISLPRFPNILQIGSKMPSMQYSSELNGLLWDKLALVFPSPTFNGVKIPNIPSGLAFNETFPRGEFPVEMFLPHLAVAYGFAPSFSDSRALSFTLDMLFQPNFGPDLSVKLLDSLMTNIDLNGAFDRFTSFTLSGIPLDPITFEVFDVKNYLPEIQFSLDLAPSVNFAAPNFRASDLFDALFPTSIPTIKSFGSFIKKNIMSKIRLALDGLFDAKVDIPTIGLSVDEISFGVDGFNIGTYTEFNNKLFPPMINVDAVQEFVFDLFVDVVDGTLVIAATFQLNAEGVNPAQTLSDISTSLSGLLAESGDQFESIASSFGGAFDSAAELFAGIAESDRITLLLNANLSAEVRLELSFEAIAFSTAIKELDMAFLARISDTFDVSIGDFGDLHITPSVQLRLQAENTATPFDVVQNPSAMKEFWFAGDFEGIINVAMDNVPAEISLRAYSPYLTNADNLEFEVRLDINLVPIQDKIIEMLEEIAALSYPTWLTDTAPYLPEIDLKCVATSGRAFLDDAVANSTSATITGFLHAIKFGCSENSLLSLLSGGYDSDKQELVINIIVDIYASGNVREALRSLISIIGSIIPVRQQQFFNGLSVLDSLVLQGSLLIDLSIIANIPSNIISESNYGNINVSVLVNQFEVTASFGSTAFSLGIPIALPSGDGTTINFNLTDASFLIDFFIRAPDSINLVQLFTDDQDSAVGNLDYGGTFEANLPLMVGIAGLNIDVDLMITDANIFEPDPVLDYAIDLCDVYSAMIDLFDQLKAQVVEALDTPFANLDITVNIDKMTDPLIEKVDSILANFTEDINVAFSAVDCNVQSTAIPSQIPSLLPSEVPSDQPSYIPSAQPSSLPSTEPSSEPSDGPTTTPSDSPSAQPSDFPTLTPSSNPSLQPSVPPSDIPSLKPSQYPSESPSTIGFIKTIKDAIKAAISAVNEDLKTFGVSLSADVLPYFDSDTFSIGVGVNLSATIEQTAADVLELVSDYVVVSTNSSEQPDASKLGLGNSTDADDVLGIDLDKLLSKVALAAGLDVSFGIDLSLTKIQDGIFTELPFDDALRKGIALYIDTWGAFAEIIVDPIELDISLFGRNISIRDSHFATSAELRSRGKFLATIDDMILGGSAIDTTPLIPDLIVPLSTEFVFDIPVTDQIVLSPIMSVESANLIGTGLAFDFDVDIGTFLNNNSMGEYTLTSVLENATNFLQEVASIQPELNVTGNTSSALDGFFDIVSELNDFGMELLTYIDLVNQVQTLIPPEMRPVIKHAAHLSRRGCSDASETFVNFSYSELNNAGVLPDNLTIEDFSPCDHLQMLQHVVFSTNISNTNTSVTYENFVIVPESLSTYLHEQFSDDVEINGPFLLDKFGHLSFRRFITFFNELFSQSTSRSASRRRTKETPKRSPAMMRGALMRAIRQPEPKAHARGLEIIEEPLVVIEINEFISLSVDFNFGEGQKDLLFGILCSYDSSEESLADSIKDLLKRFMAETLGSSEDMPSEGGFSFVDTAEELASDLIESLVIDLAVDLDFTFGLDLNPMFNSSASGILDRLPDPFIQIKKIDIEGVIGVNDWTSTFDFSGLDFAITEAKALLSVSSTLSTSPIRISSPSELVALVKPPTNESDRIVFQAGLDVVFPVFLVYGGIGFGAAIEYLDEDLLDDIRPSPTTRVDVLIEVAKIQWAAEELRDLTAFLGDFEAFSEIIPVVDTSVNKFIAGEDRTIADLFDFTDWANSLEGTKTDSNDSTDMITLSELLKKMRDALGNITVPDSLPSVPDLNNFELPPVLPSNNCNGNDKAISLDINAATNNGLEILICTFLDFNLEGKLSADGLLDELEEYISLELDAGYVLKGAFSTGIKITVASLTESPLIEIDPIMAQLYLQSDLLGTASLGLFEATVSGNAILQGNFSLGYCTACDGTFVSEGYQQAGQDSSFYFSRLIGYDLEGRIELSAGMPGVEEGLGVGVGIGIKDDDIFDDISPVIELPTAQSLLDSMKFSPQNAVTMLQILDTTLAQATGNKAFDAHIPLLDTSVKDIIDFASVFTSALFEFFVMVQPFGDRGIKSLMMKGGDIAAITPTEQEMSTYNSDFELYVLREDLTVNPIPERAEAMRAQAIEEGGLCAIQIPAYSDTDTADSYLDAVVSSITASDTCTVNVCRSEGCNACTDEGGNVTCVSCDVSSDCDGLANIVEYKMCDCDAVVTVNENNEFTLYTVSYKMNDTDSNDIKLIGIFNELTEGETLEVADHYGLSINSPAHPAVIPRFNTMSELTAKISQVITDFTNIPTNITAVYKSATDDSYGSFMFGIEVQKSFEYDVSFSTSLSMGDFSSITVDESFLVVGGSFLISNEFGVILGPDETKGLKIISQISESACTSSTQNLEFDIILYYRKNPPVAYNISITSCAEGAAARAETVRTRVNTVLGEEEVTVSLVGSSSLVLAFNPHWSKVQVHVPEENIYGLKNDTQKKSGFHFANGATALQVGLELSGGATVSASVLDTIEVAASIDASISGELQFSSGSRGQLVPLDTWISNFRSMMNTSDEFHDPDFATSTISIDGNFGASVELREPFAIELPVSVDGFFVTPFELDLLDISAVSSRRPDIQFDVNLPNIGDIKNLSFGEVVKLLQQALEFLVGDPDNGDTVESCSGGLLGKEIFGKNVFTYKIPVIGISACEFAGFLQIVVDVIDQLVNDCTECDDPNAPNSSFTALETKLNTLLQDAIGGTPSVEFTPTSDDIRSSLDVDLTLQWSFLEAHQLNIDLAAILEGLDLDKDLQNFAKGLVAFDGTGRTEIAGSISFSLGIGLEYIKSSKKIIPYIRGITGVTLVFSADANAEFQASIGALSATVGVAATIDNYGEPLTISIGLDPSVNYYISTNRTLSRSGFQRVSSIAALGDEISVAIKGQVVAEINAEFVDGLGDAYLSIKISDINNVIQQKPGAVALYYKVSMMKIPSFIDILLLDPLSIVNAVDNLFKSVNELTLGREGVVTNFPMPFIGTTISRSLKAGSSDNFLEKARRTVKGTLDQILNTYQVDDGNSTVADLVANVLTDLLGNELGILNGNVSVQYYEHNGTETLIPHDKYNEDLDVKSLMWTIPMGQTYTIELPPLNFDLDNPKFPLQIDLNSAEPPTLSLEWSFSIAFGFDEDDGFFLYTFPHEDPTQEESEIFIRGDFNLPISSTEAKLLYFLNLGFTDLDVAFGAGIFVNIDKANGMRRADNSSSVRYGRLTLDDMRNRVPSKKDLFVVCASAAAAVTVDDFYMELDLPVPALEDVKPWIPKLNVGGDSENKTLALQAIIKKEISTMRGSKKTGSSLLQPKDRRRLEASIPSSAHRGLRMLCGNEVVNLDIDCPVNTTAGEFSCVKVSNIRLDITKIQELVEPILRKLVNPPNDDGAFDEVAKPLEPLDERIPGLSDISGEKITFLDIAEALVGKSCGADTVRTILTIWRGLRTLAELFADANDDGLLVANSCIYKPNQEMQCEGGAIDFANDDGSRRLLELAEELEDVFPTHDLSGQRVTAVHSHYRMLTAGCPTKFAKPKCEGSCTSCKGKVAKAKCKARKLKCKASSIKGISFPFMSDPSSLLGLFSGEDIEIIEFHPPPMVFVFEKEYDILLYGGGPLVYLNLGFGASVTLEYAILLDSKGIREAVQEKNPLKALNSFAIRDIIDGVDSPMIVLEAWISIGIEVSAIFLVIGVTGKLTARVEIDLYDPYPDTSGGLIRPFELLMLGSSPLDWFEITLTITLDVSIYLKVGIFISLGFAKIEFTVYEKRWDYNFVLLGPLVYAPDPIEKIGETDTPGPMSLKTVDLLHPDLICESKGGSVGEEEIQCWEGDDSLTNPKMVTFVNVQRIRAEGFDGRRLIDDNMDHLTNGRRQLETPPFEFKCILSEIYLRGTRSILINYERCKISSDTFEIGSTQAIGVGVTTYTSSLQTATVILPTPIQDTLTTVVRDCNAEWNLVGYSNILIYGSEIQSGCKIHADGTSEADAVITVDFGRGSCSSGTTVALNVGSIFIGDDEIISFGAQYKDIIFAMSDCDDEIVIAKTYPDASSVEVLGYDGNDNILLGDESRPLDTIIFANIIIDGGRGNMDILKIRDQGSVISKPVAVRPTTLKGIHGSGSETISYFGIENINLSLGTANAQVNVYSTAKDASLTLTTQDGDDSIEVQNVQGPLKIFSGCGDDEISIKQTKGDVTIIAGAGIHSNTNLVVEDTVGGVIIDFGAAKQHTMSVINTQGDISIDTGFRVLKSFITIEETLGDINLIVGSGKMHTISLSNTTGAASVHIDAGDRYISTYNTSGSLTAALFEGNDDITLSKTEGTIAFESGDGSHVYTLSEASGNVDITVGDGGWYNHLFNLTDIDGFVSINAGDGGCVINGRNMAGSLTGVFGDGDDRITLANTADIHITSGNGDRSIFATSTSGSFAAMMGNGDDRVDIYDTTGTVYIRSGDGLHNATLERTAGNIDIAVGRAVGRGSYQLFTITETTGNIELETGNGDQNIIIEDTSNGKISLETGLNTDFGKFVIRNTVNGKINLLSKGGGTNNVTVVNTEDGSIFNGDVSIVIGSGPCTLDTTHASGDIYIDLQGLGDDVVNLLEIGGSIDVKTWDGNDQIAVDKLHGSLLIEMGSGDDVVSIDYLGGNGTVLGDSGDDMLLLDARGTPDHINTMDGTHLNWNGGTGNNSVEMYFVSAGTVSLNFYNVDPNQILARCSAEEDPFIPSFSSGLQQQSILDNSSGYFFVYVHDCCAAHFTWENMCDNNSARRLEKQTDRNQFVFAPNYSSSECEKKLLTDFEVEGNEKFDTLHACCRDKFPNYITSCCETHGAGGCTLAGTVNWLPDWANGHCYEKDINLIEDWEWRWAHDTLESCCSRYFASSDRCDEQRLMLLKFYAVHDRCDTKAMSEFRAMEERFDSLNDCCRVKFPQSVSDCCKAGDGGCSLSGNIKYIPKWQDQICYTKDENLLAGWERAFAKSTLRECCEHNMHYDVENCCKNSEKGC